MLTAVHGDHAGEYPGAVGGGVPGVWDLGGYWEGLYRVPPGHLPGPIFNLILRLGPTYGQRKLILRK